MRRLLLLRHAKTERTNPGGDHARRLTGRGPGDAIRMGQFLARETLSPDYALVSDAQRTQQTFQLLAKGIGHHINAKIEDAVYLAEPAAILEVIRTAPDSAGTLIVIGHNPGLQQLAYDLGQRGPHKLVAALAAKFATCALAAIDCDCPSWRDIDATTSALARLMTAKALRDIHAAHEYHPPDPDDDC